MLDPKLHTHKIVLGDFDVYSPRQEAAHKTLCREQQTVAQTAGLAKLPCDSHYSYLKDFVALWS